MVITTNKKLFYILVAMKMQHILLKIFMIIINCQKAKISMIIIKLLSRRSNLFFGNFRNFMMFYECKCCKEYFELLGEKLTNIKCITCHPDFNILCKVVLETAAIRHRRYKSKFKDIKSFTNK